MLFAATATPIEFSQCPTAFYALISKREQVMARLFTTFIPRRMGAFETVETRPGNP